MPQLYRPILLALRYRWSLVGSVLTSLMIGILWGGSITAVYPLVEIVFKGKTVDSWLTEDVEHRQTKVAKLDAELQEANKRLAAESDPATKETLNKQVKSLRWELSLENQALALIDDLQPKLRRILPSTPFGTLVALAVALVLATLLKGLCLVANSFCVARIANRTVMDMRRIFYRSMLRFDQQRFEAKGTSHIMTQLSHNINLVGAGLRALFGQSIREPLKMLTCLSAACFICWKLLLVSLLIAPFGLLGIRGLSRRMKSAARKEIGGMSSIFRTLMETINGIKVVKTYNAERREHHRFKNDSASVYRASMRIAFYDALIRPVTEFFGILVVVVALLSGAHLVLNHGTHLFGIQMTSTPLSGSALIAFFGLLAGANDPARKLSGIYNQLVRAEMASKQLYTDFERPAEVVAVAPQAELPIHAAKIEFQNVCFAYHPPNRILHHVNLEIPFGQTVVLIGANGCGKSTLLNLMQRQYDPTVGKILVDGVDIKHVSPIKLRKQMAVVQQEPILFRGTIRDNVLYGAPYATPNEFERAVQIAQVTTFIDSLELGYDTIVGEGGTCLSGGQRQRLALARAILADPKILILDEATSQLDKKAERQLYNSLQAWEGARTTLMITHRVEGIRLADRVIEMSQGKIVVDESADEFMKRTAGRGLAAA